MKKIAIIFCFSLLFFSCSKEPNPIVRTWEFSAGKEYQNMIYSKDTILFNSFWFFLDNYSFVEKYTDPNSNSTLGTTNNGKWALKNDVLILEFKNLPTKKWNILELSENKLHVKEISDSTIIYEWYLIPASL